MRYITIIDGEPGAYGAAFPDLPGCTAMGDTVDDVLKNAAAALEDWAISYVGGGRAMPVAAALSAIRADYADDLAAGAIVATVGLVRGGGRPVRVNMSIDANVLAAIDAEADRRGVTRSGLVELLARQVIPTMA